ncbi:MAG: NAD-dependent epimerase/dehydratase family protein [Streptosporangiaceae bacterium]
MKVCVTGASGRAGRAVVADLIAHGHKVVATDLVMPAGYDLGVPVLRADLTDFGQAVEVLTGCGAVVHMANIPAPGLRTPAVTYNANMTMNFNVFMAASSAGLSRVVWASSETTLGLPFDIPPRYAPLDEAHYPIATTTYALSKVASETIAGHIAEWSGIPFIALRFSNILGPTDYPAFRAYWNDPRLRKWNLWGYIDERDAAAACRLSLDADINGSQSFIIAAADTVMTKPSAELMREVFPTVPLTRHIPGTSTLLSIEHARQALGFTPRHTWRDHVSPDQES